MERVIWVLCLLLLISAGCDTTIDPVRKDTYSIYGYLSPTADQQFIRVKPLDTPLRADANRLLEATVTLQNLENGRTHTLRDSVVAFVDDGDSLITHNFWTDSNIEPKTNYRVAVRRDGEVVTTASTTTPTDAPATVVPLKGNCLTSFRIRFNDVSRPPIRLLSSFQYNDQSHRVPIDTETEQSADSVFFAEFVPENDILDERIPGNDVIEVPFGANLLPPRCLDLQSKEIGISYVYASSDWDQIDVEASGPATFIQYVQQSGVQNGQGFLGALSRGRVRVTVDTSDTLQTSVSVNGGSLPTRSESGTQNMPLMHSEEARVRTP